MFRALNKLLLFAIASVNFMEQTVLYLLQLIRIRHDMFSLELVVIIQAIYLSGKCARLLKTWVEM